MIRGKLILLTVLTAVSFVMNGCSGASTNSNSSAAKKDTKPAPKLSEKKPVEEIYLARANGSKHQFEYSGYMDKTGKILIDLRKGLKDESENKQYTPTGYGTN